MSFNVLKILLLLCMSQTAYAAHSPELGNFYFLKSTDREPSQDNQIDLKALDEEEVSYLEAKEALQESACNYDFNYAIPGTRTISCSRIERDSDTLIIFGQGPTDSKEMLKYKALLVSNMGPYDVLTFDYPFCKKLSPKAICAPIRSFFTERSDDIHRIISQIRNERKYTKIVGLGICYSGFIFAQAQAEAEALGRPLFDKLILDSPFISPASIVEVHSGLKLFTCIKKRMPTIDNSLQQIKTIPLFFIHGTNDTFLSFQPFLDAAWNVFAGKKTALITPCGHLSATHASNMTHWGIYRHYVNQFIQE